MLRCTSSAPSDPSLCINGHVPVVGGRSRRHTTRLRQRSLDRPSYLSRRLQSVLNAAARLIFGLRRSDHVSDALIRLHWLRIPQRIQFKVAVLTYKVLNGCAPSYLRSFVRVADLPSRRALRSANTSRLIQRQPNRSSVGERDFPVAGPQVWNSLPPEVIAPSLHTFRRRLKTHLFTVSYSDN